MKKYILIAILACCGVLEMSAQNANVSYSVQTRYITSREGGIGGNCWESGDEEYTGYIFSNDNADANEATTGCQQCNNNGDCTYAQNMQLQLNRTNGAYFITARIDAWEDDGGNRCNYDGGDDCHRTESQNINFREHSIPSNGLYVDMPEWGSDHRWSIRYTWKYSGVASLISPTCPGETAAYTTGIRSWSANLTAGRTYYFATCGLTGENTYMRIYGSNGYTQVASNDDACGSQSAITFTPTSTETYYIELSRAGRLPLTSAGELFYEDRTPFSSAGSITGSTTICTGSTSTISNNAFPTGPAGTITYQWQTSPNNVTFTDIPSANGSSYTTPALSSTTYYRRKAISCKGEEILSNVVTITVSSVSVGGSASIASPTICINNTVGVTLSGQNGTVLFWEMQYNGGGYSSIGNAGLAVITSPSLTAAGTYDFRARVQNAPCVAVYSATTSVTVIPASVGGIAAAALSPVCLNGNTTVSLSSNVGNIVRWERQINGGGFVDIGQGGLSSIPTGVLNTAGTWQYRAVVQNSPCGTATSSIALITVNSPSVGGTALASGTSLCNGDSPTISITGNTGDVLYWERQVNGGGFNNIGNAGSTSFSAGALATGIYDYRAVIENSPCATATSASVSITVSSPSVGGSAIATTTQLCEGGSTNITLSGNTGAILNWEQQIAGGGWVNIGNAGISIINSGALPPGANEFRAIIQNGGCASVASSLALVNVNPTSVGGAVASNFPSVCDGSTVTLTLSSNTGTITQWERQFNGGGWNSLANGGVNPITTSALTPFGTYEFRALVQSGVCAAEYSATVSVAVTQNDNPAFSYPSSVYCQGTANPSPTIALGGGTFSAAPAGLAINASNGIIDLAASAPGTYTVTHTTGGTCSASATQIITVTASQNTTFNYGSLSYCLNAVSNPVPTVTASGGTFTTLNPGLIFVNASTGEINLALSQPGSYFVQYSLGGSCPSSSIQTVILGEVGISTFSYPTNNYCQAGTNPVPTVSQFGGTFSATPLGLVFANNQTGEINLATSNPGTYTITYTSVGPCTTTTTRSVTINAAGDPFFFYSVSSFCKSATNPSLFVSVPGGSFTSSPAGLVFVNPATGEINLAASQAGNYTITYNTGGICPQTLSQAIQVIDNENATFNYPAGSYCQYDANPLATVAEIGGTFTSSPAGLVFANQFTGLIDLAASSAGTYTVAYTVPGACIGISTQQVIINVGATASLSYPASSFCSNGTDPVATVSPAGGIFTSSPLGLSIDAAGTIDLSASVNGAYSVSYTAPGLCGTTANTNVIVVNAPQANIQTVSNLCTGSGTTILTASPSGGVWSGGAYISASGVFDPSVSGAGSFPVNYLVNGSGGCNASATYNVVVNASPSVAITAIPQLCSNDTSYVLTATPNGGTWSGNPFVSVSGLFYPIFAGQGTHPVIYTLNNGGCSSSVTANVTVSNIPTPIINPTGIICTSGGAIGLSSNISGGTWSGGPYISTSGTFTPSLAAVGNNTVTYTTTSGTCMAQATTQIAVSSGPNVNLLSPTPFCANDAPAFILANIPGGVFTGGSYVSGTGLFSPANAALGNNVVMYSVVGNNGCVGADTIQVLVNANPDAGITYPGTICEDAAAVTLTTATAGGAWSGGAYINSSVFDPAVAGLGSHSVTYTVTTSGCSSSSSITITIDPKPIALFNSQPNGLLAYFTDLSQHGDTWSWNFGDGSADINDQSPTHQFPDNGTYQVRLIVFNNCGSDTLVRPVMVNKAVGIEENMASGNIQLFPNPAADYIQLSAQQLVGNEWSMKIVDMSGKTIIQERLYSPSGELNKTIDIYTLKPGIYFIQLRDGNKHHNLKFIKL